MLFEKFVLPGRSRLWSALLAVIALIGCSAIHAQTITGSIRGVVTDQNGAVVAGTKVTATNVATKVSTTTTTDKSGTYNIPALPIGNYLVKSEKDGFNSTAVGPFALDIDQIARINFKLQLGEVDTTVEVASDAATVLQTENATLGTTITANTLESLPLSGQNFSAATMFVPGAVLPTYSYMGGTNGTERDTSWGSVPSFNGNRSQTNNYILDGVEINETINNLIGYNPAPEALQQMRILTGNANAEFGNVNGGEIIMVTKGGTNTFHGSLYSFYENQDLTANLWSNNYNRVPKGVFHQNQFGATFGGPIIKNKLFFFVDYEGYRNTAAGTGTASVASNTMRSLASQGKADLSELLNLTKPIQLYDTHNGLTAATTYSGNIIPLNNPVAQYLFTHPDIYPTANRTPTNILTSPTGGNYAAPTKTVTANNQGDLRVDYVVGTHDSINGRYSQGDAWDETPKPVLAITFPGSNRYPFLGFVVNEVHTFSSTLQNEFRAGFSRVTWLQGTPYDSTGQFGTSGNSKVGIPFPGQPYAGFSQINLSSSESNIGTRGAATTYFDNIFDYGDDITWVHGRHIIKGGAQVLRYQQNSFYPSTNGVLGLFSYNGSFTKNSNVTNAAGYGFADFILDESSSSAVGGVAGLTGQRQYRLAFYAQDDWKVTPSLTVNLGLRYSYDQPIYEVNNKEVNVDFSNINNCPNCLLAAGQNGASRALYDPFYKAWMPRIGFAYQMNPGVVIRGGYGITDHLEGTGANLRLTQNAPFIFQYTQGTTVPTATAGGTPISVTNGFATGAGNVSFASTRYDAWAKNLRPALIQQFNLATQFLLNSTTSAQIAYVGQIGQHLIVPQQANQWRTPGNSATAPFAKLVGTTGTVYLTQSEGVSNYHALQVSLRQRTAHGLEYNFHYTWSRAMTNSPGFYGVLGVDDNSVFQQNIYDPHSDYGPSGFDTRNAVNANVVYQLPFGHGRQFGSHWNRWIDTAIGGWKIAGDAILYSGFPITITGPSNSNSNIASSGAARPNQYRSLIIRNRSLQHWFGTDPTAATNTTTVDNGTSAYGAAAINTFGNAHINTERAPGYRIIDMSLFKAFRTYKEQQLTLRADAFNAFNMASYSAPTSSISSAAFGQITSTLSPARQFQFSAKYQF